MIGEDYLGLLKNFPEDDMRDMYNPKNAYKWRNIINNWIATKPKGCTAENISKGTGIPLDEVEDELWYLQEQFYVKCEAGMWKLYSEDEYNRMFDLEATKYGA